jgi:hypothetical protein
MSLISFALLLVATLAPQEQTFEQRIVQAARKQRAEDLANLPELKRIGDEQRRRAAAERAESLAREQAAWRYGNQARQPDYSYSPTDSGYATTSYVAPGAYFAMPVQLHHMFLPNANVPAFNVPAFNVPTMFRSNAMFMPRSFRGFSMRR